MLTVNLSMLIIFFTKKREQINIGNYVTLKYIMHKQFNLLIFAIVSTVIGIVAFSYVLIIFKDNKNESVMTTFGLCSGDDFAVQLESGSIFIIENVDKRVELVNKIKLIDNYELNSDCMYVVTMDSILSTEIEEVEANYALLITAYENTAYTEPIASYAQKPDEIRVIIDNKIEAAGKNTLENAIVDNSFNGRVPE